MNGTFVVEQGTIADVLAIMLGQNTDVPHWARLQGVLRYLHRRISQFNPRKRARRNVAHHYDLDGRLYSLFLDADRQYSCAYFETPEQSLDDAQLAKKRHLAAKLLLERGKRVLDIGCGWGGLGLYLSEFGGADVTGVTLSQEQHAIANERAAEKGLAARARFLLQDYRDIAESFDRIVSVGMFEHVGVNHYDTFFRKSAQRTGLACDIRCHAQPAAAGRRQTASPPGRLAVHRAARVGGRRGRRGRAVFLEVHEDAGTRQERRAERAALDRLEPLLHRRLNGSTRPRATRHRPRGARP